MAQTQRKDEVMLGVGLFATPEEIKSAYRRAAMEFHPDLNRDPEAAERFSEVHAAYKRLIAKANKINWNDAVVVWPDADLYGDGQVRHGSVRTSKPPKRTQASCSICSVSLYDELGRVVDRAVLAMTGISLIAVVAKVLF